MAEWRRELVEHLAGLRLRPERESEIVEELSQHLDDRVRELIAAGADPAAARAAALADLDAPGELARRLRDVEAPSPQQLPPPGSPARGWWLHDRWQDSRHAVRALRRRPGFAVTVIATLALTIGPTTAILSVGNWLLWRPAPGVSDPSRLAVVWFGEWRSERSVSPSGVSYLNLDDLRSASRTLSGIAGLQEGRANLAVGALPPAVTGVGWVTANVLDVLGIRMVAGRTFVPEDDELPYGGHVAVVSEGLARRAFGEPANAIGQRVLLNGRPLSVIGVLPAEFTGIEPFSRVDVWYPGAAYEHVNHFTNPRPVTRTNGLFYSFVARLAPGVSADAAQAELDVLVPALAEQYPEENEKFTSVRARVFAGLGPRVLQRDRYAKLVVVLLAVGGTLLLVGCANVANLLMVRGVRTRRERAIRLALGASRSRLVLLHLTETALVTLSGAALGVAVAFWLAQLIAMLILPGTDPGTLPHVPLDARVLVMTLGVSGLCGLAAGLAPALMASGVEPGSALAEGGSRSVTSTHRLRTGLAVVQFALSLALVTGALMLVTTLRHLHAVPLGFDPAEVSLHILDPRTHGYAPDRARTYLDDILERVRQAPGITTASLSRLYPFGSGFSMRVQAPAGGDQPHIDVYANAVTAAYFDVLRIPLVRGRLFSEDETAGRGDSDVIIIGERLSRRLFGEVEPIGQRVLLPSTAQSPVRELRVVGVVRDVRWNSVLDEPPLFLYGPFGHAAFPMSYATLLVRSPLPQREVAARVGAAALEVDPTLPVQHSRALSAEIDRSLADRRVFAWMLSLLGWLGFVLAAVGLYGLLAQGVTERTRELGIRIALGSSRTRVFGLVLRQAVWIGTFGTAAGLMLAYFGSRLIDAQLVGVTRLDISVYLTAAASLAAVVLVASLWPARAATRIEPVEALRSE